MGCIKSLIIRDTEPIKKDWDKDEIKMAYYYTEHQKPFGYRRKKNWFQE